MKEDVKKRNLFCISAAMLLIGMLLAGCANAPLAASSAEEDVLCKDVLVAPKGEVGKPVTRELAEYLRGLVTDKHKAGSSVPAQYTALGWEFLIDEEHYAYCYVEGQGYMLLSRAGECYGIGNTSETASFILNYREGKPYYDISFEGYLLQMASLIPTPERTGLSAKLYLNNEFYLQINDQTVWLPLQEDEEKNVSPIQEEGQYWQYATKLNIIETEDTHEPIVLCCVGWSINGYGFVNEWGLYQYGEGGIEKLQYAPGEFEKLRVVMEEDEDGLCFACI